MTTKHERAWQDAQLSLVLASQHAALAADGFRRMAQSFRDMAEALRAIRERRASRETESQ